MQEKVIIDIERYDGLLRDNVSLDGMTDSLIKGRNVLMDQVEELKEVLLESNLRDYTIKNNSLENITNIESSMYGLENTGLLLKVVSLKEMNEYIEKKKKEFENGK